MICEGYLHTHGVIMFVQPRETRQNASAKEEAVNNDVEEIKREPRKKADAAAGEEEEGEVIETAESEGHKRYGQGRHGTGDDGEGMDADW